MQPQTLAAPPPSAQIGPSPRIWMILPPTKKGLTNIHRSGERTQIITLKSGPATLEGSICSRNNIPETRHCLHPTPMGAVFPSTNKVMVKLRSSVVDADTTPRAGGKEAMAVKVLAPGGKPPSALHSSKQGKEDSKPRGLSTPNRPALKAPCLKGPCPWHMMRQVWSWRTWSYI
jgi:hypothetical protein